MTARDGGRPALIEGLQRITDRFDHVLLDQWGVLHDGRRLYPRIRECLASLRGRGKTVTILSNSGRRGFENARRLEALGLPPSAYDGIITSGDAVWAAIAAGDVQPFDALGRRCLLFTRGEDRSVVDGLDLRLVRRVEDADFVLLAGLDEALADLARWREPLTQAAAAGVPMICANPDTTMIAAGVLLPGPGAVAHLFALLGGTVTFVGKPHRQIYATALKALGDPPASRVLAVGDSLDHDVLGAARIGASSLFIIDGVQAPHFADMHDGAAVAATVRRLAGDDGALPDWVMPRLVWSADQKEEAAHG